MDDHSYVAAVDLGATHLRAGIIDEEGNVLAFSQNEVKDLQSAVDIRLLICSMIEDLGEHAGITPKAIGVSTAGPVDLKTGSVVGSPNMKCEQIFLAGPLKEKFGVPVTMMTDCKAGVLGEYYFGGAKDAETLVYLTFSTGIGAGVLERGKTSVRFERKCLRGRPLSRGHDLESPLRLPRDRTLGGLRERDGHPELFPGLERGTYRIRAEIHAECRTDPQHRGSGKPAVWLLLR